MKDKTPSGTPPPQAGDQKANGPGTPGKSKKPKAEVSSIQTKNIKKTVKWFKKFYQKLPSMIFDQILIENAKTLL